MNILIQKWRKLLKNQRTQIHLECQVQQATNLAVAEATIHRNKHLHRNHRVENPRYNLDKNNKGHLYKTYQIIWFDMLCSE